MQDTAPDGLILDDDVETDPDAKYNLKEEEKRYIYRYRYIFFYKFYLVYPSRKLSAFKKN